VNSSERVGALYHRHLPDAVRLAYLLTGNRTVAEDLAQDAFLRAASRLFALRDEAAFGGYLRRAVLNTVRNAARRGRLERAQAAAAGAELRDAVAALPDVATRDTLWQALHQLPERQRAALVLRFYLDLSESETASLLRCRPGTVKSAVSRGLAALRRDLAHTEGLLS
jgi:RNA polymerase sigma-70 factor (sigma-E family)